MHETLCSFGPQRRLQGVLTPARAAQSADRPAVIFLTAGLLHRVGPCRLYADLARQLAGRGHHALRFDLRGVGYSDAGADVGDLQRRAADDARAAIDYALEQGLASDVVLVGLCSGAYLTQMVAAEDSRVSGGVLLDGYAYPTKQFYLRRYGPRLLVPTAIASAIGRRVRARLADAEQPLPQAQQEAFSRDYPPRAQVEGELIALAARGCRMFWIYSGGESDYYNYDGQFYDMFPALGRGAFDTAYYPLADHTYMLLRERRQMCAAVLTWFTRHFGAA